MIQLTVQQANYVRIVLLCYARLDDYRQARQGVKEGRFGNCLLQRSALGRALLARRRFKDDLAIAGFTVPTVILPDSLLPQVKTAIKRTAP